MKRRKFITLIGGAAAVLPFAARAQTKSSARIGYIGAWYSRSTGGVLFDSFRHGMRELGYVVGQNLTINIQ